MLFRLVYLGVVNVFAVLRLLPGSDRDEDAEILRLHRDGDLDRDPDVHPRGH
jgi:hypothetical protein